MFGDQLVANHGVAEAGNHTWVLGQVYTSLEVKTSVDIHRLRETRKYSTAKKSHLEAIVKVPLASASSQNLSLDHILLTWECLGDLLSL